MGGGSGNGRTLNETPTWAVAGVCALIILVSILLENGLQAFGTLLKRKHKAAVYEALDKIKGELMVLGFISLILTFSKSYICSLCVASSTADTMLPCRLHRTSSSIQDESDDNCEKGYKQLITNKAIHQLHILIFFLAVFHVLYSAMTMMLGKLKIKRWKNWERETLTPDYEISNDPSRFRLTHELTFVKTHYSFWATVPFFFYAGCFFRQFFKSVDKSDYLTLRHGFITAHIAPGGKFDFQKYIKRSLEDDFKMVVGVSPVLWASFVIFLLLNVDALRTHLWASIYPVIVILAIGTKLQAILTKMALDIAERHSVIQGIPLVQASDSYFWISKPRLILHLLHFTLFQNAFQITYYLWILYEFESNSESCFQDERLLGPIKIVIGISAMILCSYSTLPLYALVTQMGSTMKKNVFDEQTTNALNKWHKDVKNKKHGENNKSPPRVIDGEKNLTSSTSSLTRHSSGHILRRFMSTGRLSRASTYEEIQECDCEGEERSTLVVTVDNDQGESEMTTLTNCGEIIEEDDPRVTL